MSSLAGALEPLDPVLDSNYTQSDAVSSESEPNTATHIHQPNEDDEPQDEDMQDLFGGDQDVEFAKHEEATTPASSEHNDGLSSTERRHRDAMEYPEQDEGEQVIEHVVEADAAIPNIAVPKSSDGNYWIIRMPNFIKVDSKPFHPDTYVGPEQEDDDAAPSESVREKSMSIKLKVENTVRWRWLKDQSGQDRRQSNSRVVRWSDGSLSLQLGKELFDITQTVDTSGSVSRQSMGSSQSSQSQPQSQTSAPPLRSQGLTYLVAQHKRAEILQCEALVTGYMSLRPTGMQSETHRMLVRAVGQKHSKVARLRMAPDPTVDPEREKMELIKQAAKKPKKPRGAEDDGFGSTRKRRSYQRKRTGEDMWSDDDEEDAFGEGGSEEEYGAEGSARKKAKRRRSDQDENSKKGPGEYQTDDFVVADSDEDDGVFGDSDEEGSRKRTRRKHANEGEPEEDDLEKLEAKLDQQEAEERKRRQREGGADANASDGGKGEQGMDIESEEEDDDFNVRRRAAPGARKRRAIGFDDEEE